MKANKTTIMILICAMCFLCVVSANVGNTSAYEAEEITSQTTAQVSDDYEFDGVERENEASQSEIIRNGSVTEERNFNEDGGGTIRVSFRAYWVDNKGVEQPLQRVKVVFKHIAFSLKPDLSQRLQINWETFRSAIPIPCPTLISK